MLKKILKILLVLVLLAVLLPMFYTRYRWSSFEKLGTEYWPMYLDDADEYVWIDDTRSVYLINHRSGGMLGVWKSDSADTIVFFGYSSHMGEFDEYSDGFLLIYEDENSYKVNMLDGFPKDYARTKTPIFTEDGFSVKIDESDPHKLLAGVRKLHFTKYEKTSVSPSDFGFSADSWDDVLLSVKYYYRIRWGDGNRGDFYFDDYDGTSSEKCVKFKALLDEGKEEEAMELVDDFGLNMRGSWTKD